MKTYLFLFLLFLSWGVCAQTDTLLQAHELRARGGLPNFFRKLSLAKPVTIAYLGGSITNAGNGYREQSVAWLQKQYPASTITHINAGIGGTGTELANFRLKEQVLRGEPDLVFVEFAVNDQGTKAETIHSNMEGIVRNIWRHNPHTDICFVYTMTGEMAPVLNKGELPAGARAMEDIADYYQVPSIDMGLQIVALSSKGELVYKGKPEAFPGKMVFSGDNVHPYPETGHHLYTEAIARSFMLMAGHAGKFKHPLIKPYTEDIWVNADMIPADKLQTSRSWKPVVPGKDAISKMTPVPFPSIIMADSAGASIRVVFKGTMIGLYDLVGPGSGQYDVIIDGKPFKNYIRFDKYALTWRPQYFVVSGLSNEKHTVEFKIAEAHFDKKEILKEKAAGFDEHPEKYKNYACFAAYLLLNGKLVKSKMNYSNNQ